MNLNRARFLLDGLNEKSFFGRPALQDIKQLEEILKNNLPKDYMEYIFNLGCGYVASEDFLGLGGDPYLNVVRTYNFLRESSKQRQLPAQLVPLRSDGYGNYDCIDLVQSSEDESAIVFWLHDGKDPQNFEMHVKGFWNWFCNELDSIRDFDAQGSV